MQVISTATEIMQPPRRGACVFLNRACSWLEGLRAEGKPAPHRKVPRIKISIHTKDLKHTMEDEGWRRSKSLSVARKLI
jgi:hypothetical protein